VDGEPEAWFNPIDAPLVEGNPAVGEQYCSNTYKYPHIRAAGTLWYHDHVVGNTHMNVFAGLAGFYILQPATGASAALDFLFPGVYDFPLALQDRSFTPQGHVPGAEPCLCYSVRVDQNDLRLGTWQPEWAGQVSVVNGKIWPVIEVAQRAYRFRMLAGANARTFNLLLDSADATCKAAVRWYQIGTEGGLYGKSRCVRAPAPRCLAGARSWACLHARPAATLTARMLRCSDIVAEGLLMSARPRCVPCACQARAH
jgi:spore coat protein A